MNVTYEVNIPPDYGWGGCNKTDCVGMFGPVLENVSEGGTDTQFEELLVKLVR